ncbi:hypothetical protein LUZ60_012797 [Juncus effusus]|nr:hypothetical protein LUZ60_012797 [Juncus effusus]
MATAETSGGASPEKSIGSATAGAGRSGGGGGGAADSYIGSLISLTSKSEIRYEGILYTINTEESSIGLRNVRSFGTEGRKKDGPQIPASDKIYEFILFRGSDIKDLQVKSPVQPAQPAPPAQIHNDPAIIQSQYTRAAPPTGPTQDPTQPPHFPTASLQQRPPSPFQSNIPPLYQPNNNPALQSWGPQPNQPSPPVYWQPGYYPPPPNGGFQLPQNPPPSGSFQNLPPPSGSFQLGQNPPPTGGFQLGQNPPPSGSFQNLPLPTGGFQFNQNTPPTTGGFQNLPPLTGGFQMGQNQQQTGGFQLGQNHNLVRPPHGMQLQYPPSLSQSLTPMNLPELPPLLQQTGTGTGTGTSNFSTAPVSLPVLTSSISGFNAPSLAASLSLGSSVEPIASAAVSLSSSKLSVPVETNTVPLLTPGQLLQTSQTVVPTVVPNSSTVPVQNSPKEIEIIKVVEISNENSKSENVNSSLPELVEFETLEINNNNKSESNKDEPILAEPLVQVKPPVETKEPLLPSPAQAPAPYNKNVASHSYGHHNYNNYRGRGRGRGPSAFSRQVTKFTEEFDFIAMNEKFNKDEVWDHLGKSKGHGEFDENDLDESLDEDESEPKQPVYVKDDFFDSLSCTSLDQNNRNGRPRFSEQMKLDTETFGNFPRHHRPMGMRGGRGPRGGFTRGGYNNYNYNYNNNYNNNNGRGGYNNRGGYGYNNSYGNNGSGRGTRGPVYTNNASS